MTPSVSTKRTLEVVVGILSGSHLPSASSWSWAPYQAPYQAPRRFRFTSAHLEGTGEDVTRLGRLWGALRGSPLVLVRTGCHSGDLEGVYVPRRGPPPFRTVSAAARSVGASCLCTRQPRRPRRWRQLSRALGMGKEGSQEPGAAWAVRVQRRAPGGPHRRQDRGVWHGVPRGHRRAWDRVDTS